MAKTLSDHIAAEVERVYGFALKEVLSFSHQDSKDVLLRRFSAHYDTLSIEEIMTLRQGLGHQDGEEKPCKACRIIAKKEFDLAED
jgi:hypothetical protein